MKLKTFILTIAVAAFLSSPSAQARNFVHQFQQHAKKNIAAVWLAKDKNGGYAWGSARGENADAEAKASCAKSRKRHKIGGKCRRLAGGGAKCFALYVRPYPHKFKYALARGQTEKRADRVAHQRCGKNCKREIVSCAADDEAK